VSSNEYATGGYITGPTDPADDRIPAFLGNGGCYWPEAEAYFGSEVLERLNGARPLERFCVASGRAVHMIPGDRCREHGAAGRPCTTDLRPARCQHEHLSPNHPTPHCSECGRDVP
jgi:hypothetical protein